MPTSARIPLATAGSGRLHGGMAEPLLTLDDVAERLNTSHAQVYALVRSGQLPAMKMGGRGQWRVTPANLAAYIEAAHTETAEWVRDHPMSATDDAEES